MNNNNINVKNDNNKGITNKSILSCGIILIKFKNEKDKNTFLLNINKINDNDENNVNIYQYNKKKNYYNLYNKNVEYLVIQRKCSLSYTDFIRGKYECTRQNLVYLLTKMSYNEIENIRNNENFDDLWINFWGKNNNEGIYMKEYENAKIKFDLIKNNNTNANINNIIEILKLKNITVFSSPEWEFPKGHKKKKECNINCAKREFEEESGFNDNDYEIIKNVSPIYEKFIGSDGKKYTYIYYLAIATNNKCAKIDKNNINQIKEIGNIGFFNYNDIVNRIRYYLIEKKKMITNVNQFVNNNLLFCIS
jgi:hypothetical protein